MRGISVIILFLYFLAVAYIAIYSSLYIQKVKQARVQTGMEIPHLATRFLSLLPPLSSVLGIIVFILLLWETITFFSTLP